MQVRAPIAIVLVGLSIFGIATRESLGQDVGEERAQEVADSLVGTTAPDIEIGLIDDRIVKLGTLFGHKPIYLKFWATWCIPCREQMPHLQSVYELHGDDIAIVAVNVGLNETIESVRAFQKDNNLTVPIAWDSDGHIGRAFDLTVTPQHVLIDQSGTIRYIGHLASHELDLAINALKQEVGAEERQSPSSESQTEATVDTIHLLDGTRFQMDSAAEEPKILFFFATWCDWYLADTRPAMSAACVAFQEKVNALHQRFGDRIQWLGIAQSLWTNSDDLREYQDRYDITYPLGLDTGGQWFARYQVRDVPTVIVLDRYGEVRSVVDADAGELDSALESLLTD